VVTLGFPFQCTHILFLSFLPCLHFTTMHGCRFVASLHARLPIRSTVDLHYKHARSLLRSTAPARTHDRRFIARTSTLCFTTRTHDLHSMQIVLKKKRMRASPYVGWDKKFNSHSLRGAGQPDLHFAGQVRDGPTRGRPTRFAIPNLYECL